jgi:ketohexokinase
MLGGMAKILAVGNAVLDRIVSVEHYPEENTESRCLAMHENLGGNCVNSLNVLAQLHHDVSWCGSMAQDNANKTLISLLTRAKIDYSAAQSYKQGTTPISTILLSQQTGSRTISHFRDLPELDFDYFAQLAIEEYDWLHFEGRNLSALAGMLNIASCFLTHQPISLEVEKERDGIDELLTKAHILMFSQSFALGRGYSEPETFLRAMQERAPDAKLFCGWGSVGAFAMEKNNFYQVAANTDTSVIDTLGAGDVFNAGIIDALIRGHSTAEALALAVRLAEKKIAQQGINNLFSNDNKILLAHLNKLTAHKVTVVEAKEKSIVLARIGDGVKAYVNNCPHANVPLNSMYKVEIDPREMTLKCSVHDAFFRVEDGFCVRGPCQNQALQAVPIVIDAQGRIFLS